MSGADAEAVRARVEAAGQGHVFRFWDTLDLPGRDRLTAQLAAFDFDSLADLADLARSDTRASIPDDLAPAPVVPLPQTEAELAEAAEAWRAGEEALRAGRAAVLVVAGGQGTRLGWAGPKGAYPIGPVSGHSLFQIHAEKVVAARRRYGAAIPLLIMTSPANDRETRDFLAARDRFGLPERDVIVFAQGTMPVTDGAGRLLLDAPDHVAESPNGHGGVFAALESNGVIADLRRRGIDLISYIQVDNALVRAVDPVFIGRHVLAAAAMSSKVCRKRDADEGVAVVGRTGGRLRVIEYSDLPDRLKYARRPDGRLLYEMGSIAIHILSLDFVDRMAQAGALPFHVASKRVPHLDETGRRVEPAEPNGVKFEMFVFDALHDAPESVTMETAREEEFAPLKNAEGADSPETVRQAIIDRSARWLERAGVPVPRDGTGRPAVPIEIAPVAAACADDLAGWSFDGIDFSGPVYLRE